MCCEQITPATRAKYAFALGASRATGQGPGGSLRATSGVGTFLQNDAFYMINKEIGFISPCCPRDRVFIGYSPFQMPRHATPCN
jgi:hypothetical protein